MANTKLFNAAMEAFDDALDWEMFSADQYDSSGRFFSDIEDLPNSDEFRFISGTMDHTGASITIEAINNNEHLQNIIESALQHYKGTLTWDNDGYGCRQNYVYLGGNNDTMCTFLDDNDLPYRGVQFTVTGEPSVLSSNENAATLHVKFKISNFETLEA